MEHITILLPSRALRKLRAYTGLVGASPDEIEYIVGDMLDKALSRGLREAVERLDRLDGEDEVEVTSYKKNSVPKYEEDLFAAAEEDDGATNDRDASGISSGLGDDDEDLGVTTGGLTEADLDNDMAVEDPTVEATAEALDAAEDFFSSAISNSSIIPRQIRNKRGPSKSRGKVTHFTETSE